MTPQDIITSARYRMNDTQPEYRMSDPELLGYFNDGLRELSSPAVRPDLYITIGDFTCTPGASEQAVTFAAAQQLLEVLCIHGGAALTPFDIPTLDAFSPGWRAATAGPAAQWAHKPGDLLRFFIYPPAPATPQVLDVRYVRNPTVHALGDTITEIPAHVLPALVDYVVYRAESKDDEHSNSGRDTASYAAFLSKAKGAA